MPSINAEAIPPRLQPLVAGDPGIRLLVGTLTPDETEFLTSTARGQRSGETSLSRHRAIGLIATAVQPPIAIPVFDEIAGDAATPRTVRVAAIRGLAEIGTPTAQASLVATIADPDQRVQQAAFAALGQFGDASALPALEGLGAPADEATRKQFELAKALIAHRIGAPGIALPPAVGNPRQLTAADRTGPVVLTVKSAEATAADQARFRGSRYAIQLAGTAYGVQCGRAEWTMFVNRDLESLAAADRLLVRPWVAALLARWMPPGIASTTQYLVLTRPEAGAVRLDIVRTDGEVVYTGSGVPEGSGLSFDISDVARPQTAPTRLTGVLDANGVRLDTALVARSRLAPTRTEPARPEPR